MRLLKYMLIGALAVPLTVIPLGAVLMYVIDYLASLGPQGADLVLLALCGAIIGFVAWDSSNV